MKNLENLKRRFHPFQGKLLWKKIVPYIYVIRTYEII